MLAAGCSRVSSGIIGVNSDSSVSINFTKQCNKFEALPVPITAWITSESNV